MQGMQKLNATLNVLIADLVMQVYWYWLACWRAILAVLAAHIVKKVHSEGLSVAGVSK